MNLSPVALLIGIWLICCAMGCGAVYLLLPRHWHLERFLLMPIFGASVIIFLSSLFNYAGLGMRSAAPLVVGIGAAVSIGGYFSRRHEVMCLSGWRVPIYTNLLGFSAGLSALSSVVLYNAWNPYTDAFTYCSIADYLQGASYFTPANPGAHYPVLTQMLCYQRLGLRMGSNFLLAFFTALFRGEYSFDDYMPVLALGLWLAVPGFWVLCRRVLFMPAKATALATGLYGLHIAIPITNALWGFLPQTWGAAFMFPMIALHVRATSRADRPRRLIAAGAMGGMTLLSYSEIIPFALIAIGTCYLVRLLFGRLRFFDSLVSGIGPLLIAIVLAPVAASTFGKAIATQMSAVVGWDVKLHFLGYVVMLAGFRLGLVSDPVTRFLYDVLRVVAVLALISVLYACFLGPLRTRRQATYLSLIFLLSLAWFSICVVNPWNPAEVGHPWTTYKVVTYGFFLFAAMWGLSLLMLWQREGLLRLLAIGQLTAFVIFFPLATLVSAKHGSSRMRAYTGVNENPTSEYKRLRRVLAVLPVNSPLNLIFPPEAYVHRRLVAYFLRRPVIANWSADVYIWPWLDPGNRALKIDLRYPSLVYTPFESDRTVANLTLDYTHRVVMSSFGAGWYDVERDGRNWWRWLEKEGEINLFVQQEGQLRMRGEIAVVGVPKRAITLSVIGQTELTVSQTIQQRWFAPFASDSLMLSSGNNTIVLSASGPATRMGQDPRDVRIGVRNVSWELLPNSAAPLPNSTNASK